jgi:hypothetical protein
MPSSRCVTRMCLCEAGLDVLVLKFVGGQTRLSDRGHGSHPAMQSHKWDAVGRLEEMGAQMHIEEQQRPQSIPIAEGSMLFWALGRAYLARLFVRLVETTVLNNALVDDAVDEDYLSDANIGNGVWYADYRVNLQHLRLYRVRKLSVDVLLSSGARQV